MIVYGRNPVREALRGRRAGQVGDLWASDGAARESWLRGRELRVARAEEIERRCGSPSHQGICAEAGPYPYASAERLLEQHEPLLVALDQVQDPQNLGSICRTAECAGAAGVVIPERRSAEVTPAVCKASAGAVEHLPVARVRNLADFLELARKAGCWCYGASPLPREGEGEGRSGTPGDPRGSSGDHAATAAVPYEKLDYRGAGVVLVLGSEGRGLRPRVAGACDALIGLPLRGRVESLGVSAAASALLYGILQSRAAGVDKAP